MARPRRITDERIDAAARAVFLAHGPAAPVSLVARRLGVSHTALLQRAGSKAELLLRALAPGAPHVLDALREPPPVAAPARRLAALLRELLDFHGRMLPGLAVLRTAGLPLPARPPDADPPPLALRRALAGWLAATGAFATERAAALAEALLACVEARCFNAWLAGAPASTEADDAFVEGLVAGLLPELSPTAGQEVPR